MPTESIVIDCPSSPKRSVARATAQLALMRDLASSLEGSHKALVALDLAGLVRETAEQAALIRKLKALAAEGALRTRQAATSRAKNSSPVLDPEITHCAVRIREATRLQAALLARLQGKLRVLANMLAGPGATYDLVPAANGAALHPFASVRRF